MKPIRNCSSAERCQWPKHRGFIVAMVIMLSLFGAPHSRAQSPYTSILGRFQVDQVLGCAPFTVTITKADLQPGHNCTTATCQMTFEPKVNETNVFSYTYTTPGSYYLRVVYQSTLIAPADSILITVLPNIPPAFELYTCAGNGVTIKITDKNYDQYYINYGDGSPVKALAAGNNPTDQHFYPSSGAWSISLHGQKINAADNCNSNVQSFNAVLVLPVPFISTLTAIDANNLKIDFTPEPNIELQLQIATNNSGTFQLFQNLYGVSTSLLSGLDLTKNFYCFRLNAHDACSGADTPSNIICSQKFSAQALSDDDQLTWATGAGAPVFSISRDGAIIGSTSSDTFDDTAITCNTPYCYQLSASYGNGSTSISLSNCVTSISKKIPSVIDNTSAVVSTGGVELTFLQDPAFSTMQYRVFRRAGSADFGFLSYSTSTVVDDASYTTGGDYCYEINYTDACLNSSPLGSAICPLRLLGTIDKNNTIHLFWNGYKGWKNGVQGYTLEKFDKSGVLLRSVSIGTDTVFTDNQADTVHQVVEYLVTAASNDGLKASVSNQALFTKEANLYSPTAFTPDKNHLNETFTVRGFFITRLELRIFNRWGTLIFSTDKNEPWDGTFNGRQQPNDTYVWRASITDLAGQSFSRSGTVVLLTR